MSQAMIRPRNGHASAARTTEMAMSRARLMKALKPCSGTSLTLMTGHAVEVLEAGAQGDELQQVGHHLDVDALAAGAFDQVEHLARALPCGSAT